MATNLPLVVTTYQLGYVPDGYSSAACNNHRSMKETRRSRLAKLNVHVGYFWYWFAPPCQFIVGKFFLQSVICAIWIKKSLVFVILAQSYVNLEKFKCMPVDDGIAYHLRNNCFILFRDSGGLFALLEYVFCPFRIVIFLNCTYS